jgi:hypothetical protein
LIEWTRPVNENEVRCPYCVQNGAFRLMARQAEGDWFFCNGCGHLALPTAPSYRCTCGKCASLYARINQDADGTIHVRARRIFERLRRSLAPAAKTGN